MGTTEPHTDVKYEYININVHLSRQKRTLKNDVVYLHDSFCVVFLFPGLDPSQQPVVSMVTGDRSV